MNNINICGVNVSAVNINSTCRIIDQWITSRKKVYICVAPASTIVDCQSDKEYLKIVNNAGMVTPDGMPLVWIGKLKGNKDIQRTYGPDLMLALCDSGQEKGYRHYLYGGEKYTCQLLENALKKKFHNINIVGKFAPPYRSIHDKEDDKVIDRINQANPDILWVSLGSPKQDYWMHYHRDRLNVPVIIGIGAAFDFISGVKRQAPRWIQKIGCEWFFRFCCEPKRLWRRYLIGNTKFIYYLLRNILRTSKL